MANVPELTEANFETEVLKSDVPVLVDFWAPWCGPCRMLGPVIQELAGEYAGKVKVAKVNTDDCQTLANAYGVHSLPTLVVFKGGEPVDRFVGLQPKSRIQNSLNEALS